MNVKAQRATSVLALGAILCSALMQTSWAHESLSTPEACIAPTDASREAIRQKILHLGPAPSDDQIQAATGLLRVDGAGNRIPNQPHESVLGSVRSVKDVSENSDAEHDIVAPNVTMFQPRFYTSVCGGVIERYVVADFSFQHRKPDGVGCTFCSAAARNTGGYDGFGLSFSDKVYDRGADFATCDFETGLYNQFVCGHPTYVFSSNSYGKVWGFQDKHWTDPPHWGQNADNGRIVYTYERYPGTPTCVQAFTRYEHTWSSTTITGFGVGPWQFSVSWNRNENHWPAASPGGDACP